MAAVVVTSQNARLDDAESTTDWNSILGGQGLALETDFVYQGSNCIARKGGSAARGIFLGDTRSRAFDQVWQVEAGTPTFVDETTDANSATSADWDIFPTSEATTDYVAIGFVERFSNVLFDSLGGTAGVAGVVVWEYWNGSWTALSGVTDGTTGFTATVADGQSLIYTMPTDWVSMVLNGSADLYYIRARITTVYSTNPIYDQGFIPDTNLENGLFTTVMFKGICTTPGLLDSKATDGWQLGVGSGSSDFFLYDIHGNDTYPIDKSWLIIPIDPNVVAHRTPGETSGTPILSRASYFSLEYDQSGVSKSPNQGLDAVDVGSGLTLAGGDGGDTDGVWQDFSDHDFGTVANRFGYVREIDGTSGTFLIFGQLIVGTSAATVFQDTGSTLFFPDGLFAAGFSGITVDLQSATTDVDLTDSNFFGQGTESGEDTRPTLTVTSTSGAFNTDNCVFDAFASLTLTSACTLLGGQISNSEVLTQNGATLDGIVVAGATTADGVAFIICDDPSKIKNMDFNFSDGHAMELTATGTFAFVGNSFTGYGAATTNDAAIFNNSGGAVTLTITGGTVPTIRNGSGASTNVVASVDVDVHVEDSAGADLQNAQVSVHRAVVVAETAGAGNNAGDFDLVITGTIPADQPGAGYVSILDRSTELTQGFRYASHDGASTFTFVTNITGTVNTGGTATALNSTDIDFLTADIEEGDTIRNTTTGEWAIVDEITDADNIVTTPLTSGVWGASDAVEIHELPTTLISGVDIVDMPLSNGQTDASGDAPTLAYDDAQTPTAVTIRVRSNQGGTKFIPFKTSGTIVAGTGLTLNVVLQEDTVAT